MIVIQSPTADEKPLWGFALYVLFMQQALFFQRLCFSVDAA